MNKSGSMLWTTIRASALEYAVEIFTKEDCTREEARVIEISRTERE